MCGGVREEGGRPLGRRRRSGAFPPSAVTTPWPTALRLFLQLGFLSIDNSFPCKTYIPIIWGGGKAMHLALPLMCAREEWSFLFL